MKKYLLYIYMFILIFSLTGCNKKNEKEQNEKVKKEEVQVEEKKQIIDATGDTLMTRILVPDGYIRDIAQDNSLTSFIRNYKMKEDGSNVKLYDGTDKSNQTAHAAIFTLPLENYNLQQCADSVMRMYAEYYWNTKQYNKISFHFVNGFEAKYGLWIKGYKIKLFVNKCTWIRDERADASYESFKEYLKMVFAYASTISMDKESVPININDINVGDIFIKAGSPGHVVMVVDVCTNNAGKKAFLLAQGYMPAQEFHVLKNPAHSDDPWYYVSEISYPLKTPEYTFEEGSLKRPQY